MWLPVHDIYPRTLGLSRFRFTFDALKRSAKIVFAPQSVSFTTTTPSTWTVTLDDEYPPTLRLSGAAIAAVVGLGYDYAAPATQLWLLPFLHGELSAHLTSSTLPLPLYFDSYGIDAVFGDEAPRFSDPTLPSSLTPSTYSTSSVDSALQPSRITACSPAESPSLSLTSTPYASSSSADSDSSFEAPTPSIDHVGIPDPEEKSPEDGQLSALDLPRNDPVLSEEDSSYQVLEAAVVAMMQRLEAQQHGLPNASQMPEPDNERPTESPDNGLVNSMADGTGDYAYTGSDDGGYADTDSDDGDYPTVLCNPHSRKTYRVDGIIGIGGFSRVVRAFDDEGQMCAIKVILKPRVYERRDARETLLREKSIMAQVSDLGTNRLVHLYESWEDNYLIYFVMEYSLCSLHYLIAPPAGIPKTVLTWEDKRAMCIEMISALSLLHQNNIVHRDIKPDNFLVDLDGGIVLADFGLSLEAELHRGINGKCGTEDYLAPEQLWGATYNSQVDVWQLACTLIELFGGLQDTWMGTFGPTGSPLSYDRLSLDKIQEMLDLSVLDIMPDDHPATNLILQMIAIHPDDRPTVEDIKAHAWFKGIDWDEVAYGPPAERNFELHDVPIDLCHRNLIYSTFLQAASEPQRLQEVEATINTQMDMYVLNPLAFVHPPPRPIA